MKLITIVGNVGAGKSTATPIIAKTIGARILFADNIFQTTNPFRDRFLQQTNRWAFTNELWMMIERVKLFNKHTARHKNKLTVIDSGLLMSWVYTYGHFINKTISKEEWVLYENVFNMCVQNIFRSSYVVFLEYSYKTLLKRIQKRGRDYELKFYTKHYLQQIEKGLRALKRKLTKLGSKCIVLDEKNIGDFENRNKERLKLVSFIKKNIKK